MSESRSFQWDELHRHLAKLEDSYSRVDDAQRVAEIFARRAEQMAHSGEAVDEQSFEVVAFDIEDEHYAIEMRYINEIMPPRQITRVPGVPSFVLGVVSRRGEILSVIDLGRYLGLGRGMRKIQNLILVGTQNMTVALAASAVQGIATIPQSDFQGLPAQLSGEQARFTQGIFKGGIALLNVEEMLGADKLMIDQAF